MKLIITDIEDFNNPIEGEYKLINPSSKIQNCIGCFGCWIKTPGKCVLKDDYSLMGANLGKSDELIIISKLCYGSVSPFVKMAQDRAIGYMHPDFVIRNSEMHHKRRYQNVISLTALFYGDNITDEEKETARELMKANALNYDGPVKDIKFYNSIEEVKGVTL